MMTKYANVKVVPAGESLDKFIKSVHTRGARLERDIHRACVSAVAHRIGCGDNSYMQKLVDGMPKGQRTNAIILWFNNYGSVEYNKQTKKFANHGTDNDPIERDKPDVEVMESRLQEGARDPYWNSKAQEGVPFDALTDAENVLKLLERHINAAEKAENPDLVTAFKAASNPVARFVNAQKEAA